MTSEKVFFLKKIRVSEGIILKFVLSEEWDLILKHRASEIRVKRIRVNQGLGVPRRVAKIAPYTSLNAWREHHVFVMSFISQTSSPQ